MNVITMRNLGRMGRAGNQLFQVGFLRLYAQQYNCQLQLPPWFGNELFGADDPPITVQLPQMHEVWQGNHLDEHVPPEGDEFVNTDWVGYGQYETSYYRPHRNQFRGFFQPVQPIREPLDDAFEELRSLGKTVIGIHRRVGDYGRLIFALTPVNWYKRWLRENWDRFEDPVLFVATEDRSLLKDLAEWSPFTTDDFGVKLADSRAYYNYLAYDLVKKDPWQLDWYPDLYFLSQCDVIVGSNSTFSFAAAMLAENLKEYWRSSLPEAYFEKIDPWNARPMRLERCEDYPHLEGISVPNNPYW